MISRAGNRRGPFSLKGREVAIDAGETQHTACHGKEYEGLDEGSRKAEIQKEQRISIRLSEIPTNELHKHLYLYFIFYLSFNYQNSITI